VAFRSIRVEPIRATRAAPVVRISGRSGGTVFMVLDPLAKTRDRFMAIHFGGRCQPREPEARRSM